MPGRIALSEYLPCQIMYYLGGMGKKKPLPTLLSLRRHIFNGPGQLCYAAKLRVMTDRSWPPEDTPGGRHSVRYTGKL
jgi:hypothetical protein